nr:GNAT family N-acetyltransferase [uncultured Acetatifactor sp.]
MEKGIGQEEIQKLSKRYNVRKLTVTDIDKIYALAVENSMFYQYCPPDVTRESILADMKALPPRMTYDDKYYIGYFDEEKLVAVMDLILGYPNEETAFIGLFMMDKGSQGQGIGSAIVEECFAFLGSRGYRFIRLGFAKGNPQSEAFWRKNGFAGTGVEVDNGNYIVVVMERPL